jgi:kumamolisin
MLDSTRRISTWMFVVCLPVLAAFEVTAYGIGQPPAAPEPVPPSSDRKMFTKSVIPLPEETFVPTEGRMVAKANANLVTTRKVDFTISLSIPEAAQNELAARVAKGEVITKKEMDEKYSPKAEDIDKLVKWLKDPAQGLEIVGQAKDRSSVYVRGTVPKIESALKVQFVRVLQEGVNYTAVRNAPSLPSNVAQNVSAIIGLQPFLKAQKRFIKTPLVRGTRAKGRPDNRSTGAAQLPTAASVDIPNAPPYIVREVLKAYSADNLGVTGNGQTIGILIDTFPNTPDITTFWQRNNLNGDLKIELVNVTEGSLDPASGEETLDAEWSSGVAPGAKVRVYASGSLGWNDLNQALDRIYADLDSDLGLRQLSISLGLGETYNPRDIYDTQNTKFLRLSARGVNIFVSSGDAGSRPSADGHHTTGATQTEFGSSSPFVVAVGGTTLVLNSAGGVKQESAWKLSGGGESLLFDRPVWQKGLGIPSQGKRLVPDVALVADSDTGAFIVLNGAEMGTGGTSWSAPVWAGFAALINESRTKANKAPLPFLNPLLYSLPAATRAKAFRDITLGDNIDFQAGAGHNNVTGLGVPNLKELLKALNQ